MHHLAAALHTLGVTLTDWAEQKVKGDPDRGSVTIEQVLWAVAVIAIVGIVAAAITTYVRNQSGRLG